MEFLKQVKKRTGSLTPQWFMSDDADQYFNAWRGAETFTNRKPRVRFLSIATAVDFLLATLIKIARDKTFEHLLKQEKGKNTH